MRFRRVRATDCPEKGPVNGTLPDAREHAGGRGGLHRVVYRKERSEEGQKDVITDTFSRPFRMAAPRRYPGRINRENEAVPTDPLRYHPYHSVP